MSRARVLKGSTTGAAGHLFLSGSKVDYFVREERNAAHVVAEGFPPLESEFAACEGTGRVGIWRQHRLSEASHGFKAHRAGWKRGVHEVVVVPRQESRKIRRGGSNVLASTREADDAAKGRWEGGARWEDRRRLAREKGGRRGFKEAKPLGRAGVRRSRLGGRESSEAGGDEWMDKTSVATTSERVTCRPAYEEGPASASDGLSGSADIDSCLTGVAGRGGAKAAPVNACCMAAASQGS